MVKPKGAPINYENPEEVVELMAWHLSQVFRATFKSKIERELENLKTQKLVSRHKG